MTGNVGSQPLCQHTNSTVFPQEGHWSGYDRCCLCLCSYCSLQRNSLRWDAAGGLIHLITYSSNRELRKGLSWLKGQLRNVFWLLIGCEWVINWAVIIRTLLSIHGICVRQRERALNWDSVPSCHFLFTSFQANSRFEVVFWSVIAQQTPASVSHEQSLLHIYQF